jgi:hypothetical protein
LSTTLPQTNQPVLNLSLIYDKNVYKRNELWSCLVSQYSKRIYVLPLTLGEIRMRGDASRQQSRDTGGEGRNSPIVVQSNGAPQQLHINPMAPSADTSLHPPGINGTTSNLQGRTGPFSYSSILTSTPAAQSSAGSGTDGQSGNVATTNPDKPFKYTREEMLSIWKNNAAKYKSGGIPLEFEKHEAFTSEDPLDPALLTEMTHAEREV